ncbi:probable ubiquitin-conjugating enzyme E2 24 [Glycine soja]|nr:probable ubiquitin-conjugating enzyme E2 24 [Glycine soja]XP_028190471.1 probable ubiquitin-conjugating enzyme E2 24 [Glycine soja]KHN10005.1 Putative ubiquitin-conjugating enzyme E2 24 [Glycine soja]RZB81596.1 putative ubiquitin-conjugating enzyme E2 24 isoform A [Glycine soja]
MDLIISDSDWETSSGSNSSEDQDEIDFLYGGKAQSILSSLEESIGRIDDFLSFERAFVHGDVVCSLSDPSGQMGRVTSMDLFVDLESVKGKVLKNLNSKKLLRIRSIAEGDYVIKGPWLGRVQRVVDKVAVLFDDGAKCDITALEREKLLPLTGNFPEDSQFPYYPGQRVKVKSSSASKSTRWLCDTWRDNHDEGTVCAVEAGLVYVNWISHVLVGCDFSVSAPKCWQDSKTLTVLSCFSHANWQLGDWCMLSVADQKEQITQHAPIGDLTMEHCVSRGCKGSNLNSYSGELFIIGKIKTKVDVVWQNGEYTLGLDPENLLPVNVINNHEFWPHQFVLEKGASDDPLKTSSQRWGVVQCVDAKECTVKVQWKTISISDPDNLTGDKLEETVSAYELVEHPDYSCFFGDIMFKAAQKQLGNQAEKEQVKSVTDFNAEAVPKNGNQMSYQDEFPDNYFMSCIGSVTGFKDGDVEVTWATGFTTKVAPYEIFRIEKHEGSTVTPTPFETNVEEFTHEIIEHRSLPSDQKGKDLLNGDGTRENCEKNLGECSSFSLPRAAFELFSSIKASIFQTFRGTLISGAVSSVPTFEKKNGYDCLDKKDLETSDLFTEQLPMAELQYTEDKTSYPENIEIHEKNDFPFSLDSNSSNQFKQFDVIENCPDHHFFVEGKGLSTSQVKRSWVKKVQQEWSILEKNLPETIYVRVFEERMDLMRAAIVGASGTPYHDGLFFFDICFPPEYPNEPPMVHYNSAGLRLNPNLYESGKICLSLLNTWTGTDTEVWNPGASTILQVLLSLQALVLNEKPYFNEAGYDQQIGRAEGEKNSVSYNENAFLVTTKSMMYLLRKPPKHFEALVEEHFRKCSQHILLACKAYLEGASIGCAFGSGKTGHENQKGTSTGFKIMLAKLFPKLVEAFSDKGIDCSQFVDLQKEPLLTKL